MNSSLSCSVVPDCNVSVGTGTDSPEDYCETGENDETRPCNKERINSNEDANIGSCNLSSADQSHVEDVIEQQKNCDVISAKPSGDTAIIIKTCRLCMKEAYFTRNIFEDKLDDNVPIALAILTCIYPIEMSKNDPLPKDACSECLALVSSYFKFRSSVLKNDRKQKEHFGQNVVQDSAEESSRQKRKTTSKNQTDGKKKRLISENDPQSREDINVGTECVDKRLNVTSPPPLVPITSIKCANAENMYQVEEKLRNMLKDKLTPEQENAENIIIHVQDDKEYTISNLSIPIVIKQCLNGVPEKETKNAPPGMCRIIAGTKPKITPISEKNKSPKETKEKYESSVGVFMSRPVAYLFNVSFCIADDYLFEHRLVKGNLRYLRCALSKCNSIGTQMLVRTGSFSTTVNITKPHNHTKPTPIELKKQMFYSVMRKKMQNDKGLSFRAVYEEVCKHDPEIEKLVPMRNLINEICSQQLNHKIPTITSFEQFYDQIETDPFHKIQFTHDGAQFYQEKFTAEDDSQAVIFANFDSIELVSKSKLMYVDSSFKIDTNESFHYQLMTVLVWLQDSYYPILFALLSQKSQEIYKMIFHYVRNVLMPELNPEEIITDYEANLYYALGETYMEANVSGSVFYYTQNLYKQICSLSLCKDLETNSYFRNIYHLLLMLPLLPMNTILDGLNNIEIQAKDLGLQELTRPVFDHVRNEWILKVTPELFCVHRMETRINENVVAPFKKLRDFLMLCKGKSPKQALNIVNVVERIIEVENFLRTVYFSNLKKSFSRDLNSAQKKNVLKAWQYIESHPKININHFFTKVLGYIKCMENQLWIWGFYRYSGGITDELIDARNFSIVSSDVEIVAGYSKTKDATSGEYGQSESIFCEGVVDDVNEEEDNDSGRRYSNVVMEGVIDENGTLVVSDSDSAETNQIDPTLLKFIKKKIS